MTDTSPARTADDVKQRAKDDRVRAKHNGTYQPKHPFRGGKRPAVTPWRE